MKAMFEKLAHASIMRLNPASMDKLYDLMTMAVKHQVTLVNIDRLSRTSLVMAGKQHVHGCS